MSKKVSLAALGLPKSAEIIAKQINNISFEIRTSVPYEEIFEGIQWTLTYLIDERPFISEPLHQLMVDIGLIRTFTNFDFSFLEKAELDQTELYETYDLIKHHDIITLVEDAANQIQLSFFRTTTEKTANSIIAYRNSMLGIIDAIKSKSQEDLNDIDSTLQSLKTAENAGLIAKLAEIVKSTSILEK